MAAIHSLDAGFYRVPLPAALSDSTHGTILAFELVTARVRDTDGAEGIGYTYTVGRNGGAVHAVLAREIAEIVRGADAERTEFLWQRLWWHLHYGGRGGPTVLAMSAVDIALWDRYIAEPLVLRDGFAVAPDRPGHGITFDWAGLEKVRA